MDQQELDAARTDVIEAMGRSGELFGWKRSYGQLWGVLIFAEDPLSLDELSEESDYAKSTVSTAMKTLERIHVAHRRSMPGEGKKVYYEAETDVWYIVQQLLNQEGRREIQIMRRALDSAAETFERADSEKAKKDLETVRKIQRLYDRAEQVIDLVTGQSVDRLISVLKRMRGKNDG